MGLSLNNIYTMNNFSYIIEMKL